MINRFLLTGRLTRDPHFEITTTGKRFCRFTVASKRNFRDKKTNKYESDFPSFICFGDVAAAVADYLKKGDLVELEGTIQTSIYKNDRGEDVYQTTLVAESVYFGPKPKKQTSAPNDNAADGFVNNALPPQSQTQAYHPTDISVGGEISGVQY
ncbi:single-stranded DNA-binding protein [Listeria booriae]|uniref:single-stranded DNA-binding protein n=1 Tax=Listeria booriae TaxID=1552123 RepID=UPI001624EB8E|nr:single-stranded DNA-binding protein [Listeria booriae]MBC2305841.1 single-stranded DNA-binding protein [Listeria booriae]